MLDGFNGTRQARRQRLRLGVAVEAGQMFGNQAVESAQHSLGLVPAARQGRCPCHEAGLFGNTGADTMAGNGGADMFLYNGANESTGSGYDRLVGVAPW